MHPNRLLRRNLAYLIRRRRNIQDKQDDDDGDRDLSDLWEVRG